MTSVNSILKYNPQSITSNSNLFPTPTFFNITFHSITTIFCSMCFDRDIQCEILSSLKGSNPKPNGKQIFCWNSLHSLNLIVCNIASTVQTVSINCFPSLHFTYWFAAQNIEARYHFKRVLLLRYKSQLKRYGTHSVFFFKKHY